jgi:hypothetical protein
MSIEGSGFEIDEKRCVVPYRLAVRPRRWRDRSNTTPSDAPRGLRRGVHDLVILHVATCIAVGLGGLGMLVAA